MDKLKNHIRKYIPLSDSEYESVKEYFRPVSLAKGGIFCHAGQICQKVAYIESGAIRSYYIIEGEEITRFVVMKDSFVTALSSFISQEPSPEIIQAISDCKLWVASHEGIQELYRKFPKWEKLGRLVIEESHLKLEKRVLALISLTAEERYARLSMEQPEILRQVPLHYIASILGVKPETLSRIRKKISL